MALGTVGLAGEQEQKIFPAIILQCGLDIRTENKTGEINPSNFQLYFMPFFFSCLFFFFFFCLSLLFSKNKYSVLCNNTTATVMILPLQAVLMLCFSHLTHSNVLTGDLISEGQ